MLRAIVYQLMFPISFVKSCTLTPITITPITITPYSDPYYTRVSWKR